MQICSLDELAVQLTLSEIGVRRHVCKPSCTVSTQSVASVPSTLSSEVEMRTRRVNIVAGSRGRDGDKHRTASNPSPSS